MQSSAVSIATAHFERLNTLVSAVPVPGSVIVTGPPGSGKTTTAVRKATQASLELRTELVVASEHLVGWLRPVAGPTVEVKTWRTWLGSTYAEVSGKRVPFHQRDGRRVIDWVTVLRDVEQASPSGDRQLVVDEAQDVPHRLLAAMRQVSANIIAFADPLQRQSAQDGSSLLQLVDAIDTNEPWPVLVLEEDFRTTREIQQFAVSAWAPGRLDPSRPARNRGPLPILIRGDYGAVAREAARQLQRGLGTVMVATAHADRAQVVSALARHDVPSNRGSLAKPDRVSVLAFEALRGLEFDAVVLLLPAEAKAGWTSMAADLYVAATRARKELSIVQIRDPFPELAQSLEASKDRIVLDRSTVAP